MLKTLLKVLHTTIALTATTMRPTSDPVKSTVKFTGQTVNKIIIEPADDRIRPTLLVGGLVPVHKAGEGGNDYCGEIDSFRGVHRTQAMVFAIDQINKDPNLLKGLGLKGLILDTCGNVAYSLQQALEFVRNQIGGLDPENYQCPSGLNPEIREGKQLDNITGVVGASASSVTKQVANLLQLFKVVQVSYASTASEMSDKKKFSYFARTVPPDKYQARVIADIARHYNWTYVLVVFSEGSYGELGKDAFKDQALRRGVCVAHEFRIGNAESDIDHTITGLIDRIRKKKRKSDEEGSRVVVLFTNSQHTKKLWRQIKEKEEEFEDREKIIWIVSEATQQNSETTNEAESVADGALLLSIKSRRVPIFEEYFRSLHPLHTKSEFKRNPWLTEYWEKVFNCTLGKEYGGSESIAGTQICDVSQQSLKKLNIDFDNKVQFVIDAVYALAHALDKMWTIVCGDGSRKSSSKNHTCFRGIEPLNGADLYEQLLNVSFQGTLTGSSVKFNNVTGDGPASYLISTFKKDLSTVNSSLNDVKYGFFSVGSWEEGELVLNESELDWAQETEVVSICSRECTRHEKKRFSNNELAALCCWVCEKCAEFEYKHNETHCVECDLFFRPVLPSRDDCEQIPVETMEWSSIYSIFPCVLSSLGIVLTLCIVVVYIKFNETPVVKASGRELSYILLCGMIICYLMTFVLLAEPNPWMCAVKRVGVGLGFSSLYAAMLVKTNRIYRIFSSVRKSAATPRFISPLSQVVITVSLVTVQLFGSLIWLAVQPPSATTVSPTRGIAVKKCYIEDHWFLVSLCYDAMLIIVCTGYAIRTRKVPENFNEAKFIGFTMYTTCIIWLAFVPIYFGTGTDFKIQTTTLCISISLSATVALFCIFSPKLWVILVEPETNVRKPQGGRQMLSNSTRNHQQTLQTSASHVGGSPNVYSPLIPKQAPGATSPSAKPLLNNEISRDSGSRRRKVKRTNEDGSEFLEDLESLTSL